MIKRIKRKIYKLFHPSIGEVLMLHRVVNESSALEDNRLLGVTPEFLERTILAYKKKDYDMISLDELYEKIQNKKKYRRKFVCFTFDDGYIDNYTIAYPIFKKYNCPFAIYLTTDFPDGKALLWWYVLEDILLGNDYIKLGDGSEYLCNTIELKNQAFKYIREKIFKLPNENIEENLCKLFSAYSFSFNEVLKENVLSWNQVTELSNDSICTIASHSVSHPVLTGLTEKELEQELADSKNIIEHYTKKKVMHFAYPYGDNNIQVEKAVGKMGYKTAVIANGGEIRRGEKSALQIKRITLSV
jgi:peptidoglycan/xylan/chitin deacetylase (PgdA/CDA1 family)